MSGVHTKRILRAFDGASDEARESGLRWYATAQELCVSAAHLHGLDPRTTAGVCSALSPRLAWDKNITALGKALIGQRPAPLLELSWSKAQRILSGEDVEVVLNGAPKTTAFFWNIYTGGADTGHVTVDRHAYRIAMGLDRRAVGDPTFGILAYREIAESYRRAARLRGVTPAQMQAVSWQTLQKLDVQTVWTERIAS